MKETREPIIEVNNLSKWYSYQNKTSYLLMSEAVGGFLRNPGKIFKKKKESHNTKEGFWALKNVSFNVYPGESVGIIGPNGAGKSTLLKILSQITPPTGGEIKVRGKITSLLEVGTGFNIELTGRENIFLNGSLLGMTLKEIRQKFDQIVEFADISKFLDTPVKHYSSGMYMRLAFSIAVHLEQDILLLDEVLAVGDARFQKKSLAKMEEVTKSNGRTIIFVSHSMGAVQNLCERCIFLDTGKVKMEGKPAGVIEGYLKTSEKISHIPVHERKDRRGSGRLRINNIYLKDSKGEDVTYFKSGEDVEMWFEYQVYDKKIKELYFGLGIDKQSDQARIAFLGNKVTAELIDPKKNLFKIKIKKLPLTVGSYSFTILMYDEHVEVLDWVQRAGTFTVEHGDFYKTGQLPPQLEGSQLMEYNFVA